jgi:hypothetical protein
MPAPSIRKKLYFDVVFGSAVGGVGQAVPATVSALYFPCTQFTPTVPGDRYGGVLAAVESCTGNSLNIVKARSAIEAWVIAHGGYDVQGTPAAALSVTAGGQTLMADFVQPTGTVANHANVTRLRYYNTAGALQGIKAGMEAIYGTLGTMRHFSVRVRRSNASGVASAVSARGTLYVARQHSLEV